MGAKADLADHGKYMREVFIISTGEILKGKTAGARRIINIAKSLASGGVAVYLCSFLEYEGGAVDITEVYPGVFSLETRSHEGGSKPKLGEFVKTISLYAGRNKPETVLYLYPTTFVLKDFIYLFYFKYLKGFHFFCEINELRSSIAFSSPPAHGIVARVFYFVKSLKDYVIYKLNELQVFLYDGVVVISRNLEQYFSRSARRMIRIPILCDVGEINLDKQPPDYDGKIFRMCFAGYIKCEKEGFDILFESLSRVNQETQVELFLYGILSDEDKAKLSVLSDKYGLDGRIYYMGNIDPVKLGDEFRKYHLLILPRPMNKRTMYGFSTKLSEYLVSSNPVLLTDVSDNALYIHDNHNGYMTPPGNVNAMTAKILEIIRNYNSQARNIVVNAHKTVREELDYRLFASRYIDFFFNTETRTGVAV